MAGGGGDGAGEGEGELQENFEKHGLFYEATQKPRKVRDCIFRPSLSLLLLVHTV